MTKTLMATDLRFGPQFAMNPASTVYPEWPRDDDGKVTVTSQGAAARRRRYSDAPVTVLNKDWKPTA